MAESGGAKGGAVEDAAGFFGEEREAVLRKINVVLTLLALLVGAGGVGGRGVGGGEGEGDEAAGVDGIEENGGAVGEVGEVSKGGDVAFLGADVLVVELEAFGEIDDGLATGEFGETLRDEAGGGEAAGDGDVLTAAVGLFFGEAHAESEGGVAGVFHGVGLEGGEEAFIGGKVLEDAEADGGFIDGDEVAGAWRV